MPGLLSGIPITDEQRRSNDTHRTSVVVAVLAVLVAMLYLFTPIHKDLGFPGARDLIEAVGIDGSVVFHRHEVDWEEPLVIDLGEREPGHSARYWLFFAVLGGFLCAYYLPLRHKRPALAFWTIVGIAGMYDLRVAAALLFSHTVVYLVFHPKRDWLYAAIPGYLAGLAFGPANVWQHLGFAGICTIFGALAYLYGVLPLLDRPRAASVLRYVVAQSAILTVVAGGLIHGVSGFEPRLAGGILLFFWQWQRTILYYIDFKDGFVPRDLTFGQYLGVFLTPGSGAYWDWFHVIGQGYHYANNRFLSDDKNRIVLRGIRLLLLATFYLLIWNAGTESMIALSEAVGIPIFDASAKDMLIAYREGTELSTASVLLTSLAELIRWFLIVGGLVHFKVGLFRICGYDIDPFFDKPWLATNLINFWARFTYHYREFLVRAFYYPVLLRYFRKHPRTRIVVATMAAATLGNLVWGHLTEELYHFGMRFENFNGVLRTWPYFVLLGLGISIAELYGMKWKRKRKAWTPGPRILLDILAVYCTVQLYALFHIFRRLSEDVTVWDAFRVFLRGFGIHV